MYSPSLFAAPILYIPGLIYEGVVRARNRLYSERLLPQLRLPGPVISIGNLTLGGSGKTPLTVYVAQLLERMQAIPVILSRGYRRSMAGGTRIVAPGEEVVSPAAVLGDEPALMRRHVPGAWLGIDTDRFVAGQQIARRNPRSTFILDDGFQHRGLHRDLDLVVIDSTQPLGSNHIFPRGSLREPVSALRRCHGVIVNGTARSPERAKIRTFVRTIHPSVPVFDCMQEIQFVVPIHSWRDSRELDWNNESTQNVFLVTALGNPHRFLADVNGLGFVVGGTRFFRDHYSLTPSDWADCILDARRNGAEAILITEKDAIKLATVPDFPILVCVQSTEIASPLEFASMIREVVKGWK